MLKGFLESFKKPMPAEVSSRVFMCLALMLAVLIVFAPALRGGFVNWDDNTNIEDNPAVKAPALATSANLAFSSYYSGHYFPLTILSYALEYRSFELAPFPYHLDNVLLHCLNCLLAFWLVFLISRRTAVAVIAALIFGIHPLQVDSVAWLSERKNVLYAVFYLGAIISYVNYLRSGKAKQYWLALFLFILSLLSKSMAVTLPLVLILLDWREGKKFGARLLAAKIPFFLLSAVFALAAVRGSASAQIIRAEISSGVFYKLQVAGYAIIFYLEKFLAPVKLAAQYYFIPPASLPPAFLASFVAVLCAALAVAVSLRFTRKAAFGCAFFLLTALPILQFVPVGKMIVANQFVYLPLLGAAYLSAEAAVWLREKLRQKRCARLCLTAALVIAAAAMGALSWQRCGVWKDSFALWNDVIRSYPRTPTAYINRGLMFMGKGEYTQANADFLAALRLDPDLYVGYLDLAALAALRGDEAQGVSLLKRVIEKEPAYLPAYEFLSLAYIRMKQYGEAVATARREIGVSPGSASAYGALGSASWHAGDYEAAAQAFLKAVTLDPAFVPGYSGLARAYYQLKRFGLAVAYYDKAVALGADQDAQFLGQLAPYREKRAGE